MLSKLDPNDPAYQPLQEIQKAGTRSSSLTQQLLAFARKQTIAPKVIDLNDTVSDMLKMLRRLIGEDIELIWKPGKKLWSVKMDPAQIDQILANLCINARDAMTGPGKVTINTVNATLDDEFCRHHAFAQPGSYVVLSVSDNGIGMDQHTLSNIFEPFFTTKSQAEGTGLGLSTVYGIVKQNNGLIHVYSEPDQGTEFKIYFPVYEGKEALQESEKQVRLPQAKGEHILVVEDEKEVLNMTQSMLKNLGYQVTTAETPQKALILAEDSGNKYDLLITDVIMPEMTGKQLSDKMSKLHPDIRTLFMSGYTFDSISYKGVTDKDLHFMAKPFSISTLAEKVRHVLDSAR
ncbi:MAG: response regulator [Caldithrix sp.]|nr:response regulator [Caldithrix sp.]